MCCGLRFTQQVFEALKGSAAGPVRLRQPVHIQIFIGEECDVTKSGASVAAFAKSWRSLPIRSWSGGVKMADRANGQPRHQVQGILSQLLADEVIDFESRQQLCAGLCFELITACCLWLQEVGLVRAAEMMWDAFAAHPSTASAASRMLQMMRSSPAQSAMALGRTGWNAYSVNLDFRTGKPLLLPPLCMLQGSSDRRDEVLVCLQEGMLMARM